MDYTYIIRDRLRISLKLKRKWEKFKYELNDKNLYSINYIDNRINRIDCLRTMLKEELFFMPLSSRRIITDDLNLY
tara:strand:- start:500 stop:727 length:228 start_codon:yes stop_codon:yes gene_type:complete